MSDLSNKSTKIVNSGERKETAPADSQLGDTGADVLTGINSFIRGPSNRLITSSGLGWKGISLEAHNAPPGERNDLVSADHLIALWTDVARGEGPVSQGRLVPYSFHPGATNLFPAGPLAACRPFTPTKMILCALDPAFVSQVETESDLPAVTEFRCAADLRDVPLRGIIKLLAAEANSGGLSGRLYVDHLAHALALRFLWLSGRTGVDRPSQFGKLPRRVLQRVLDRMKAELATDLDLNTLAAESGYSRSHFLRTFRAGMGCSPHQWLTRLRVEQAKTMLRERSMSLIEIALACGFSSHAHFSNAFRHLVGVTPSDYRRSHSPIK